MSEIDKCGDPEAHRFHTLGCPPKKNCPKCNGELINTAHGPYCPRPICKWGWEIEMDGSPLQPPIAREPHDGWMNMWMHANIKNDQNLAYLWNPEARKFAGDWADFRVKQEQEVLKSALRGLLDIPIQAVSATFDNDLCQALLKAKAVLKG